MSEIQEQIQKIVETNDVVLFMKGTSAFPMCGFSAAVVHILSNMDVSFHDINVLEDESIRQGIKTFSDWPTIPQLYVKGDFVGGCDIVREMAEDGELYDLMTEKGINAKAA